MKNFRVVLSLILALAVAFSCLTAFAADGDAESENDAENEIVSEFSDVDPGTVEGEAITELALRGILTGYPDGTFLPEGSITRAEFAVVITRLAGLQDSLPDDAVTHFSDLDADDSYKWARPYVFMAIGQGVISGFEDGTFRAGEPVTYEQAVKMLMCLLGYGDICESETKRLQELNSANTWSVGYINYANTAGLIKGTNSNEVVRTQPVNRGVVAQLAYNALSVPRLQQTPTGTYKPVTGGSSGSSGSKGGGSNGLGSSDTSVESGTVTATYISALDDDLTENDYNEITINGKDTYMISGKILDDVDLYDLLGQRVRMTYDESEDMVTAISVATSKSNILTVYSGYVNDSEPYFLGVDGNTIQYCSNPEKETSRTKSLAGFDVIFNGKYIKDFNAEDLLNADSPYYFTSGKIEFIENGSYKTAKISNYKNYVVKSTGSTVGSSSSNTITVFYKTGVDARLEFQPTGGSGEYVIFRRGAKAITSLRELSKYDVISQLTSPEDSGGIRVQISEVTRNSLTNQEVTGLGGGYGDMIELNDRLLQYNYEYVNYDPDQDGADEKYDLGKGDENISVYLDFVGQIACVAMNTTTGSATSWKYGYLLYADRDGQSESSSSAVKNKPVEFYMMDETGNTRYFDAKSKVYIDGVQYNNTNNEILSKLKASAELANDAYLSQNSVTEQEYQQPIRYKLNSAGNVEQIDTVAENNKPGNDDLDCGFDYDGEQTYLSGSRFSEFSVGSTTKIFFVPDDRDDWDSYSMGTYSNMFTLNRKYHVEAFNLNSSGRASMVLLYKQNDSATYNYNSSFLIVTRLEYSDNETGSTNKLTGFLCNRNSVGVTPRTYAVSEDVSDAKFDAIDRGDIVRFLTDSKGNIKDIDLWLDASAPIQEEAADSLEEAISKRTLVYESDTVGTPEESDSISAPFRLAYGSVTRLEKDDPYYITVSPTIPADNIDMETDDTTTDNSVVRHKFAPATTHVYIYNGKKEAPTHAYMKDVLDNDLINDYANADINATRVVTFTVNKTTDNSGYLRFIYIIR